MARNKDKQMHLIAQLPSGQGIEQGGWRWPGTDKALWMSWAIQSPDCSTWDIC